MTESHDHPRGNEQPTWRDVIVPDSTKLVGYQTWRDGKNDKEVLKNLKAIKEDYFDAKMNRFNEDASHAVKITPFHWAKGKYWVFGYRAGSGARKVSLICHLDTVPPGDLTWDPFNARLATRIYKGVPSDFLIGRGSIDDKGPAVVAFEAFTRALAGADPQALARVTLEVIYDTSEETDMSTPHYFDDKKVPDRMPDFGVVFDAYWSVRAEKGIERPAFTVSAADAPVAPPEALAIAKLETSPGSVNMIPSFAKASIQGPADRREAFADKVEEWYRACLFDDANYHPADIHVASEGDEVVITALVAGAQHGSAPDQNRRKGANPVVSLLNFLAFLVSRGTLANNYNGELARFVQWAFGTRAFGENHPELLQRHDSVFAQGNGTTYALTRLIPENGAIRLELDIRYAMGHHSQGWDGSEGTIAGISVFKNVFASLVERYQSEADGGVVTVETRTADKFGPDIRSPRGANLSRVAMAYRAVMGENCPMHATGGGTDAHGYTNLVTAGALFTTDFGPPVNYHGIDEGAPLIDLENSGKILLYLLQQELAVPANAATMQVACHADSCMR